MPAAAQLTPPTTPFSADLQAAGNSGEQIHGKFYFTPKHIRMDMKGGPNGDVVILTSTATETSDMMMPTQRIYMEFRKDQQRSSATPSIKGFRDPNNPCADQQGTQCKKAGAEQVNGRECDRWVITQKDGSTSTVWVDQKLHFPIKTETKGDTWQLTNITEGEPDASLFVVPAGFRKIELGGPQHPKKP